MPRTYDKDPYAILGVPPTASEREVKQAYLRLARQNHPDVNKNPGAVERMKEINWAYDILGDPHERSSYDRWGNSGIRVVYYSGTKWSSAGGTPPRSSPPASSQTRSAYPKSGAAQDPQSQGRFTRSIAWLIIILVMTLMRTLQQISQSPVAYPIENIATQIAHIEMMTSALETLQASRGFVTVDGTATPLDGILFTPSPFTPASRAESGHGDLRASFVPGSWGWEQLHRYFPHLTKSDGLSIEVTGITYDQLQGYRIETRSWGDYWLFINRYDHSIMPAHFTATPRP